MEPTVLLADNDAAVSALLAEVLRRAGLQVEAVFDGKTACERVSAGGHRVFVCDLDMPKMSGIDLLESLRAHVAMPPTMVISGYLDPQIEVRLAALPFVCAVLRKPFDLLAFAEQVRQRAAAVGRFGAAVRAQAQVGEAPPRAGEANA